VKTKLDTDAFKKMIGEFERKQKEEERKKREPQIIGKCVVCGGDIKEIKKEHWPLGRNFVGKQKVVYYTDGCYCIECGVMYNHMVLKNDDV
jgi:uncharacterized protein with PIN domain